MNITHRHGYRILCADFSKAKDKKNSVITELQNGISFLLKKSGINVIEGFGKLIDNHSVSVNDEVYTGKYIIIATGSHNLNTIIKGSEYALDSTDLLDIDEVPSNLVIIGGGVIGVEMATVFNQFGSNVTIFEGMDSILPSVENTVNLFDTGECFPSLSTALNHTFHIPLLLISTLFVSVLIHSYYN